MKCERKFQKTKSRQIAYLSGLISYTMRNTLYIILSLYICINIQHQHVWNKADYALVIKTVRYVLPPHFYIRNRIVQWAFDPAFAMVVQDV